MSIERKAKEFLEFLEKNKAVKINKESDKEICFVISPLGENEWSFWMVTCAILCERFKDVSIRFLVIDCWQEETENNQENSNESLVTADAKTE